MIRPHLGFLYDFPVLDEDGSRFGDFVCFYNEDASMYLKVMPF